MTMATAKTIRNKTLFEATKLHDQIMEDMLMFAKVDHTPKRVYLGEHNWRILTEIGLGICGKKDPSLGIDDRTFLGLKVYLVKNDPTHMQVM